MARKSKCCTCGKELEKEEIHIKNNKKFCEECFNEYNKKMEDKRSDWDLLFEYICQLYKIKKPTGMMFKQLKDYRNEPYNYTDIGMYYTLKYYYDVLNNIVLDGSGLGIIPYFYDKARIHYKKVFDLEDMADNFKNKEKILTTRTKINKKEYIKQPLPLKIDWEEYNEDN